jgi:hypothetical protein
MLKRWSDLGRALVIWAILAGCSSGGSSGGPNAACSPDVPCGIAGLGQTMCVTMNGDCLSCTCPQPAVWTALGGECGDSACATEGGPCSPQGYASAASAPSGATVLDGQPCVMNGNVCFTAESDGGHGCVCASDPSGDFVMRCGLVDGWFSNNGMPTTY